jgi:hypothetical protein
MTKHIITVYELYLQKQSASELLTNTIYRFPSNLTGYYEHRYFFSDLHHHVSEQNIIINQLTKGSNAKIVSLDIFSWIGVLQSEA